MVPHFVAYTLLADDMSTGVNVDEFFVLEESVELDVTGGTLG